ncbi:Hypothetical predicted protein [Olea europaea subsp. europaea]|uniref:Uncharacterized protein n=1 Tax=Olea europaea subsp. europaea TaxID=158383 RepID=A0A8S0PRM7_OLEEU|nr:Hypothetical predicted protein [Olea europaea subsp. europaea]
MLISGLALGHVYSMRMENLVSLLHLTLEEGGEAKGKVNEITKVLVYNGETRRAIAEEDDHEQPSRSVF